MIAHYGVSERGNFEGASILHLAAGAAGLDGADAPEPAGLAAARRALYEARARRVWPGLDDKRLAAWNALAIAALAEAGAVLGRPDYLEAASACAEFVLTRMRDGDGHLLRTYKDGEARLNAYLEDHAFLLEALLALYEASFEPRWYEQAVALAEAMIARFGDPERGGFFSTSADHEQLIARRKELGDHPIPAGNSAAAFGLLRLAALSGERRYAEQAEGVLRLFARTAVRHPQSFAHLLRALDLWLEPGREVALVAPAGAEPTPSRSWPPSSAPTSAPASSSPPAPREPPSRRSCASAPPSTAAPPPTSARTSPASCRSPTRRRCASFCSP